jgi:hypothetical protein
MENFLNPLAHDTPRPGATPYSMTLEDAGARFRDAGLPRNLRSLQRYCAGGRLDCIKEETINGLKYFVDPDSVTQAITQLAQLHGLSDELRHGATHRDVSQAHEHSIAMIHGRDSDGQSPTPSLPVVPMTEPNSETVSPRPAATMTGSAVPLHSEFSSDITVRPSPTESENVAPENSHDLDRPAATGRDMYHGKPNNEGSASDPSGYLQDYVDLLKSENSFLRQQVSVKDEQIADLLERDRESNILVQGLQRLLQPLLRGPGGSKPPEENQEFDHGQR